jgi:FkbM family methyltransferase
MITLGIQTYDGLHISSEYGSNVQDNSIDALIPYIQTSGKIIDIGANQGVYTIIASQKLPYTEFIMFEPLPDTAIHAQNNASKCNIPHQMEVVALSNYNGDGQFQVSNMTQTNKFGSGTTVIVKTLDSYCYDDITFIKIDVEGHEFQVLQGAKETITANKPVILLEYHQEADWDAIESFIINDINYSITQLSPQHFNRNSCNHLILTPKI